MPAKRTKAIHPFIRSVMASENCDTIKALAVKKDIPYTTLIRWSDVSEEHKTLSVLRSSAHRLGISVEQLIDGLLSQSQGEQA